MKLSRRLLLGNSFTAVFTATIGGQLLGANSASASDTQLTALRVFNPVDNAFVPWLGSGEGLLVDTGSTAFSGSGIYLYPAWGQPVPYRVEQVLIKGARYLAFHHPASGALIWRHSLTTDRQFAGRAVEKLARVQLALAAIPALVTPALPPLGITVG